MLSFVTKDTTLALALALALALMPSDKFVVVIADKVLTSAKILLLASKLQGEQEDAGKIAKR